MPITSTSSSSAPSRPPKADAPGTDFEACRNKLRQLAQHTERVAHDFNDLLTLVLGNVMLARSALEQATDPGPHLDEILRTAGQGTALSHQLLSFARMSAAPLEPRRVRPMRAGTIVIAEDEPMVAELTRRVLTHAGYQVHVTHDGQAALDAVRKLPDVTLVVSDIVMPFMSGLELARTLSDERPDLPMLLVSGYPEDTRRQGHETLANTPFLAKPFKAADLLAAIDALIHGRMTPRPRSLTAPRALVHYKVSQSSMRPDV